MASRVCKGISRGEDPSFSIFFKNLISWMTSSFLTFSFILQKKVGKPKRQCVSVFSRKWFFMGIYKMMIECFGTFVVAWKMLFGSNFTAEIFSILFPKDEDERSQEWPILEIRRQHGIEFDWASNYRIVKSLYMYIRFVLERCRSMIAIMEIVI